MLKYGIVLFALALFFLGAVLNLDLLRYPSHPFIFGDDGDGFFNIWVMDHTVQNLRRGDFNLFDGRIFWPENKGTFLWSDNLFIPALCFGIFKVLSPHLLAAFWLNTIFFFFLGYLAYCLLFYLLFRIARDNLPELPAGSVFFVPIFGYLAAFSSSHMIYLAHFQNLSSLWLFLLLAGGVGYRHCGGKKYFTAMIVAEVLLLYSAPYFAVLGICFILVWFLFQFFRRDLARTWRKNHLVLILSLPPFVFLAQAYFRTEKTEFTPAFIHHMASRALHLYTPASGLARRITESVFPHLPRISHESPAYLGSGLILAVLIIFVWRLPALFRWITKAGRAPLFWILTLVLGFSLFGLGGARRYTCWAGAAALVTALIIFVRRRARLSRKDALVFPFSFLILAALLTYGVALGPIEKFNGQAINPSIWGILAFLIPGITSMRAVGRLTVIGQGIIFALILLTLFLILGRVKKKNRIWVILIAVFLIAIQFTGQLHPRRSIHHYRAELLVPTAGEREWFSKINGSVAVFPSRPFHFNTRAMLYFNNFPRIFLMNGYSARSTELWDRVMALGGRKKEPTEEQIREVRLSGVDYLVIIKYCTKPWKLEQIKKDHGPSLFESERYLVLPPGKSREERGGAGISKD